MLKVTILTVVFNGEKTLRACIDSVLGQDFSNLEYIVIDGASTDNTLAIARSYGNKIYKIISEPDHGIYDAMNKGIAHATGDIIGILNADDIYADSSVISDVISKFEEENSEGVYGDLVYIDNQITQNPVRKWISGKYRKGIFLWGWMPPHPSFFLRKKCYDDFGNFRLDLGSAADYELMLRMIHINSIAVSYLPRTLVKMSMGGASNQSLANRIKANANDRKAWKVNNTSPFFFTLLLKPLRKIVQFLDRSN
jgi:glycosyltransferase involved in cell wall biosynthesis